MSTYNEQLQALYHRYELEHGGAPAAPREVVEWAVSKGLFVPPAVDPMQQATRDMARALREEYKTDDAGRRYRVNHSVTVSQNGVQFALWGELGRSPRAHMEKAFSQRRKQIIGDCAQLKVDVDVYNDIHANQEPIQLVLNFSEDVAELEEAKKRRAA